MASRRQLKLENHDDRPVGDHYVHLRGTFDDYEALLRIRGESAVPRVTYLEGVIEIMTPSIDHEELKSTIGRLVEAYCLHAHIRFRTSGSWTLKDRTLERGAEPDECYVFGEERRDRPDLAIEVIWTSGGLEKLEVYRKLGVREVWTWRRGRILVHGLAGDRYVDLERSAVLPGLDLALLTRHLSARSTYDAILAYRAALEGTGPAPSASARSSRRGRPRRS